VRRIRVGSEVSKGGRTAKYMKYWGGGAGPRRREPKWRSERRKIPIYCKGTVREGRGISKTHTCHEIFHRSLTNPELILIESGTSFLGSHKRPKEENDNYRGETA